MRFHRQKSGVVSLFTGAHPAGPQTCQRGSFCHPPPPILPGKDKGEGAGLGDGGSEPLTESRQRLSEEVHLGQKFPGCSPTQNSGPWAPGAAHSSGHLSRRRVPAGMHLPGCPTASPGPFCSPWLTVFFQETLSSVLLLTSFLAFHSRSCHFPSPGSRQLKHTRSPVGGNPGYSVERRQPLGKDFSWHEAV